ncbi:prominin-1-A-like isoform X1 [Sphaerodactylus townsendi]|uniref:prominin-1-A-like isoform X1 n=1 Tax=Sphaerodactylus townsendi TaxID=933632 RepID=UPI0020274E56|nr:prominin-1-A-like isoform X1 [Sphaerodactylus townsendi]XP_048360976.1 prominin-1-A-like isoform X1 [Sphaerodactylus townsendi]XP_048360977.1 prominin-1-A-like isoform X1 [Sphaerodactylus townsendi]XP_048360978.1 prominin-1-A-like isoform X1 [Sphaerodactylus townsendi]
MALSNLTQPEYLPQPTDPSVGLQGLFAMVHSFLGLVQPNSFPDFLSRLIKRETDFSNPDFYKEVLVYQAGFLVCIIIGVLFIILMPLVGLCFCCCRCCGNCGGRMYQKQKKHTGCQRRTFFASVLVVTIIILAGDICAYVSNNRMSQSVDKSFSAFNSTMDNLHIFLGSIPKEVDFIINSSLVPIQQTNASLLDIGEVLGGKIVDQLSGEAHSVLNMAAQLLKVIGISKQEFQNVNSSVSHLKKLKEELNGKLDTLRDDINHTLNKCGEPCQDVSVQGLVIMVDFNEIPDVQQQLNLITNVTRLNPNGTLAEAKKDLNKIPENVSKQAKNVVSKGQADLDRIKKEIVKLHINIPVLDTLGNVSESLGDVTKEASNYEPDIKTYDRYRWIVGICLCCMVLLIIVLNALGLLCGAFGLDSRASPTKRGCLSNSGGDFLMASVGFSFIFAWLLMLLVLLTFLVGGNVYALMCRPWASGQLLPFLDTPGLFQELNLTNTLGIKDSNVTLTSIYKNCKNNDSLWNTLQLGDSLDEMFNISQYTQDIDSTLKELNFNVTVPEFLKKDQMDSLTELAIQFESLNLDFTDALQQINHNLTQNSLSVFAEQLDNLADRTSQTGRSDISRELQDESRRLKEIQSWTKSNFSTEIQNLNGSIWQLRTSVSQIRELLNSSLKQVEAANQLIKQDLKEVINNATLDFVNAVLGYFQVYLDWVKVTITGEVARCGPAAWTLDAANTIVCNYIVNAWNAFWFSLGWCTIFLLPSVILAVRLAKFYRRMHMDDIYEDNGETMELSRPPKVFTMPRPQLRK